MGKSGYYSFPPVAWVGVGLYCIIPAHAPNLQTYTGSLDPAPTMCHMSCVTCHVSHAMCHMPCVPCHVSHVMCHMSLLSTGLTTSNFIREMGYYNNMI